MMHSLLQIRKEVPFKRPLLAALLLACGALSACYMPTMDMKKQTLMRLAVPSGMMAREIPADPYIITSYERVARKNDVATVYIEGGQILWDDFIKEREVATPMNPLALHMATRDLSANVIWLARPCQYTTKLDGSACSREEFTSGRYSLANLKAMNRALDNVRRKYGFTGFNLVGVADGAGVAVHLAASRKDVLSLRTVAGVLDTYVFTQVYMPEEHEVFVDKSSNNPGMHAAYLAKLPQHHFIGEWDQTVGPEMAQSFRHAAGNSACIRVSEVKGTTDEKGWVNRWPDLLKNPVDCKAGQ